MRSEKEQPSLVMEHHGIEWEDKGTHDKHLSVLDYKKEQRGKEIAALETVMAEKESQVEGQEQRLKELARAAGGGVLGRPGVDFTGAAGNRAGLPGEKGQAPAGENCPGAPLSVPGLY